MYNNSFVYGSLFAKFLLRDWTDGPILPGSILSVYGCVAAFDPFAKETEFTDMCDCNAGFLHLLGDVSKNIAMVI